jgi:hypothetical protein
VCQLQELDALSTSKDNSISFVGDRIADVERMLRNYELSVRSSMLNGTFDSEIEATRVGFFGKILQGLKGVNASSDYGLATFSDYALQ